MRGGVYHSGDLAYRDENGFAYFAGRLGDWMRVDGENLGTAPIERILLRYPSHRGRGVPDPRPRVGDQVMAALVLARGRRVRRRRVPGFLTGQPISAPSSGRRSCGSVPTLPRTETFKVLKRQLSAEGTDCADPVYQIGR